MRRYDAFKHLYLSLFAKPNEVFIMLTAYFDETNTDPNQKVPVVAGYIASMFQWSRFGEQWDKLLREWNVPVNPKYGIRIAHRADLQHRVQVFKGWTEPERDEFLGKAYAIIKRNTRIPIGSGVTAKEFEAFALKRLQNLLGKPYGWCAYTCLHQVKRYCDEHNHKEPVRVVFEMGATGWGQINQLFQYLCNHQKLREFYRLDSISFVTKSTRQIQAADFLAYDLGRVFLDYVIDRKRPDVITRLDALVGPITSANDYCAYWDKNTIKNHSKLLEESGLFKG